MTDEEFAGYLRGIEERLQRLERLVFLGYCQTREVAEYAYRNVLLEVGPEEIKRVPKMRTISDAEGLAAGFTLDELRALKWRMVHYVHAETRDDALWLARGLALGALGAVEEYRPVEEPRPSSEEEVA